MVTPGMRFSVSAMLVSGNLPMSSAKIESVKPVAVRFELIDSLRLLR